jgi:hypothetical protein
VACPFSGPADSGKPKWATFKALRNGWKFWFSRADRFKRTRLFSFFFGAMPKRTISNKFKQRGDYFSGAYFLLESLLNLIDDKRNTYLKASAES